MIRKSNVLLENQMKFFIRAIRNCGVYSAYGYTKHFIIDRKEGKQPLILTEDNESNEEIFSKVESADFWESWEKGDIGYPEFERPHS